jgi:signal transduction histidine kinase
MPNPSRIRRIKVVRRLLGAWGFVVALIVVVAIPFADERPELITTAEWLLWTASYVGFLFVYWSASRSPEHVAGRWRWIAYETALVLAIVSTRPAVGVEGAFFVLIAFHLAREERSRIAVPWIVLQSAVMFAILELRFGAEHAFSILAAYLPFQFLAYFTYRVLARESDARAQLVRVNAELLATRELLATNSRAAERLRISRELHDVFGHRLAALSVNLEAAARVRSDEKPRFIDNAREGAKGLLHDVREVVTHLRRDAPIDLASLLELLVRDVPKPSVHLECPPMLDVGDPDVAQTVLRCTQEIVTNSIKHSAGNNLWIRLRTSAEGIEVSAEDDGQGAPAYHEGNGLRGMRERLATIGGTMNVESAENAGFRVHIHIGVQKRLS